MTESRPTPSTATVQPQASENPNQDAKGRFLPGNRLGCGNPFARATAALRKALIKAVTPEDITGIAAQLLEKAKTGDTAAARILFSYTIGKPTPAVDPDTLNEHEVHALLKNHLHTLNFKDLIEQPPTDMILSLFDVVLPYIEGKHITEYRDRFVDSLPQPKAAKKSKKRKKPTHKARKQPAAPAGDRFRPSTPGTNGHILPSGRP
jgi:hypothetical protein